MEKPEGVSAASGAVSVEEKSVRSFAMSAQQVYERFEKLPLEQRKQVATWALACAGDAAPVLVMPKVATLCVCDVLC
jgi:hypothetical protein